MRFGGGSTGRDIQPVYSAERKHNCTTGPHWNRVNRNGDLRSCARMLPRPFSPDAFRALRRAALACRALREVTRRHFISESSSHPFRCSSTGRPQRRVGWPPHSVGRRAVSSALARYMSAKCRNMSQNRGVRGGAEFQSTLFGSAGDPSVTCSARTEEDAAVKVPRMSLSSTRAESEPIRHLRHTVPPSLTSTALPRSGYGRACKVP